MCVIISEWEQDESQGNDVQFLTSDVISGGEFYVDSKQKQLRGLFVMPLHLKSSSTNHLFENLYVMLRKVQTSNCHWWCFMAAWIKLCDIGTISRLVQSLTPLRACRSKTDVFSPRTFFWVQLWKPLKMCGHIAKEHIYIFPSVISVVFWVECLWCVLGFF